LIEEQRAQRLLEFGDVLYLINEDIICDILFGPGQDIFIETGSIPDRIELKVLLVNVDDISRRVLGLYYMDELEE
jgi:hypothetical protein